MVFILTLLVVFLQLIKYIVFTDIITSWLMLFGLKVRPSFIASIVDPLYTYIKERITTTIGPFELTPIIVIITVEVMTAIIYRFSSETSQQMSKIFGNF